MNLSENAPRTLGTVLGALPALVAAVVVAFVGTDWDSAQVASVLALAGGIGAVVGFLAGDRTQKNWTDPKFPPDLTGDDGEPHGDPTR